jgi:two-component system nitrate/nitrite sensor histidine kinase NarX
MSQVINGLSLELHGIAKLAQRLAGGAALAARVEDVHAGLADAKATIRQAIFELRLPDGRDLWENVRDFCTRFEDWYDLPVQIEVPEAPLRLPLERQREVLRIIQEALWNVRKHSAARGARLVGRCDAARNRVRVEVLDEGAGSDPNRLTQGQGIDTMLARAARLGATLRIEPLQPRGLVVALEFPAHG